MSERERILVGNLRLLRWFVVKRLPAWLRRLAGGARWLAADLAEAYVKGVDKWLASDRRSRVATYVCKSLLWGALRLARREYRLIRVPQTNAVATAKTRRLHASRRQVAARTVYFGGGECRCEDSALLWTDPPAIRLGLRVELGRVLRSLRPRERLIIARRFGLTADGRCDTLLAIGKDLGLTRESVRKIQAGVLEKLGSGWRGRVLAEFTDGDVQTHDEPEARPAARPVKAADPPTEPNFWFSRFKLPK